MKKKRAAEEAAPDNSYEAIRQAVSIDPLDIENEYSQIAGKIARYNELYSEALKESLHADREQDRVIAKTSLALRAKLAAEGAKVTEPLIKARVAASTRVHEAGAVAIEAKVEKTRLWGVLDALRAKRDALISLGAHIRAEMQGNPSLREAYRAQRDMDEDDDD